MPHDLDGCLWRFRPGRGIPVVLGIRSRHEVVMTPQERRRWFEVANGRVAYDDAGTRAFCEGLIGRGLVVASDTRGWTLTDLGERTFLGEVDEAAPPAHATPLPAPGAVRTCGCRRCLREGHVSDDGVSPATMTRFVVCADCGNKRCPHADDHRFRCFGSNEPGQDGVLA